jgi:hypothetical protein
MNMRHRIRAVATLEARKLLATVAARRATQSVGTRAATSFRPLTEAETAAILGDRLLAELRRSASE